jgi:hypothetical protein
MKVKAFLFLLLITVATSFFAATRYAVAGTPASPAEWANTSTWSATSGGTAGASVPTSADDVYVGELTARYIDVKNSTAICNNLTIYSGSTVDRRNGSGTLQIYGGVTNNGTFTNTSNQPFPLTFTGSGTHSISGSGTYSGEVGYVVATGNTIDLGTSVFGGTNATFTVQTGATLITAHPNGINGNLTMTGTISLNTGANYVFNGSAAQVTGTLLPTTVNNLTINNSSGASPAVTLSGNVTVNGTMTMTQGALSLSTYTFAYGTSASLVYNGTVAQTTGPEWLSTMSRPVTISNTSSTGVTLASSKVTTSTVTVTSGATLTMGTSVISGTGGSVTVNSGGTLATANTSGINGSITTTGSNSLSTGANYTFNGTSNQVTGTNLPATVNNLTFSNTSQVTLSQNVAVNGAATVTSGTLAVGTNVISGSGSFTLNSGTTLVTGNTAGVNGSVTTSTYSFSTGANYTFNGTSGAQVTGTNFPSTVNNLTINNSAGVTWSGPVTVNGSLSVTSGSITLDDQYFNIPNNTTPIAGFTVATSTPGGNYPTRIDRQWSITGTWDTNALVCRYYWTNTDDHNFDWSTSPYLPSVYKGSTEYTTTGNYSLSGSLRWVEVSIPEAVDFTKGTFTVGPAGDHTLPVELSSFTVALSAYNMVTLMWVTQSETNVSGFRIYRSSEDNLETAEMLNIFVPATNTSQMQVYQVTDEEIFDDGIYYYWLENVDLDGASSLHGPISITVSFTSNTTPTIPVIQGISQAFPNPFNPRLSLVCGMTKAGNASVDIYNARGQHVKTLFTGTQDKGSFTLQWDGTDDLGRKLSSGVYYIKMSSAEQSSIRKVVLSK